MMVGVIKKSEAGEGVWGLRKGEMQLPMGGLGRDPLKR